MMLEMCQSCESWIYLKASRHLESLNSGSRSFDFMDGKLIISKEPVTLPLTGFHVGSQPCLNWRYEPETG